MRGRSHARRIVAILVAASLSLTACSFAKPSGSAPTTVKEFSFTAPGGQTRILYDPPSDRGYVREMSGESLTDPGQTVSLSQFSGQVVVLNVWGSWCGPCREEMPGLQLIHEQMQPSGVTLLGIDVRDDRQAARDFVVDRGVTYPSLYDNPGRSLVALNGFPRNTVPSTIVLDRDHRVAAVFLTALRVGELLPVVQRVAAEPRMAAEDAATAQQGRTGT
ncbi:alkyl hydroperoxide reductase [Pseudonocardia sp. D17]|nr:alkyl hydroperoxide reductase [Pseudonocardia sp. D17]